MSKPFNLILTTFLLDVEDPEGDGGDDDKTPVRLRTSSRTPKPRQLDLPEESPYGNILQFTITVR